MKKLAFALMILISLTALSQSRRELNTLLNSLPNKKTQDSTLAFAYNEIAYAFSRINIDSCKLFAEKALALSQQLNYKNGIAASYNTLGIHYHMQSQFENALKYYERSKAIKDEIGDKKGAGSSQNNIGIILYLQGHYDKALETFNNTLKIQESINDTAGIPSTLNYIASVHYFLSNYEKALEFYLRSLQLYQQNKNKNGLSQAYNNIGIIYSALNNLDKAIENYNAALEIAEETGDNYFVVSGYNNLGTVFQRKKDYVKALDYFTKSLELSKELKSTEGIASNLEKIGSVLEEQNKLEEALSKYKEAIAVQEKTNQVYNTASIYNSMGSVLSRLKRHSESMICYDRALKIANQLHSKNLIAQISFNYAALLKNTGDFKRSYFYLNQYALLKDTILNDEKNKSMAEMQTRFDTYTKEKEISLLTKNKSIEELQLSDQAENIKKQQVTLYVSIIGIILAIALEFFILRSYNEKRRVNLLLEEKNNAISKQKQILEEKNSLITNSIEYAKNIQDIILPSEKAIQKYLKDVFVLFRPKDVVSGDFYWFYPSKTETFIAAIDCVGHGVPGAFMALHAFNLLERIVKEKKVTKPSSILNELNKDVIETLHQKNDSISAKHGMDLALLKIKNNSIEFSGARNSLVMISPAKEIKEIKADRMFIGGALGSFTTNKLEIEPGSMLYLFTDGYADQKGGAKNEKYFTSVFKELLATISQKNTSEQKEILEQEFRQWKGNNEQIDDVLIIGIRV